VRQVCENHQLNDADSLVHFTCWAYVVDFPRLTGISSFLTRHGFWRGNLVPCTIEMHDVRSAGIKYQVHM